MCTKVAHLKEGEVRLRRDSSLYPRDLDLVSAGPRGVYCPFRSETGLKSFMSKPAKPASF